MKKNVGNILLFLGLAALTFWVLLRDNNIGQTVTVLKGMELPWIAAAIATAVLFVCMEGFMIWYLLHVKKSRIPLWKCVRYSFIGFFFSGITPSATGGQPVQLYYMKKDKIRLSDSTAVLMTVAVLYKFVLVLQGLCIGIFWREKLMSFLGKYIYLYWIGLLINIIVVAVLVFVMVRPMIFEKVVLGVEHFCVSLHLLKEKPARKMQLKKMVDEYGETVQFFIANWKHIAVVTAVTFVQRTSLFLPTYFVYKGMGLSQEIFGTILVLQASVYVAVDMLPLPGAQGISEMMYKQVFQTVFTGKYLLASTLATRGINFYMLLVISGIVAGGTWLAARQRGAGQKCAAGLP